MNCCSSNLLCDSTLSPPSSHLKQLTCKGTLRQGFICLRPPPLLGFCLGWCSNFVGSESGQIQSVKLLQNMVRVSNRTPPPPLHTVYVYTVYLFTRGGGRVEPERRLEGQQVTKLGRKYQHYWMYLQSINSAKHLPQSPFTGQFFRWRHFALVSI